MKKISARDQAIMNLITKYNIRTSGFETYTIVTDRKGKQGIADMERGKLTVPIGYDRIQGSEYSGSHFWLVKGKTHTLVRCEDGAVKVLVPASHGSSSFGQKYSSRFRFTITENGKVGVYCLQEDRLVVPVKFETVEDIYDSEYKPNHLFYVTKDGKVGVFCSKLQDYVVPLAYDEVSIEERGTGKDRDTFYLVKSEGRYGVYNTKTQSLEVPIQFFDVFLHPQGKDLWIVQGAEERRLLDYENNDPNYGNVFGLYCSRKRSIIVPMEFWVPNYWDTPARQQFSTEEVGKNEYKVIRLSETRRDANGTTGKYCYGVYSVSRRRLMVPTKYNDARRLGVNWYAGYITDEVGNHVSCVYYDDKGVEKLTTKHRWATQLNATYWQMNPEGGKAILFHRPTWTLHQLPADCPSIHIQMLNDTLAVSSSFLSEKKVFVSLAGDVPVILKKKDLAKKSV